MKKRVYKLIAFLSGGLILGLLYAALHLKIGLSIPCAFKEITGLFCPGCGISTMCLAILKGEIFQAFKAQPAIMLCLPAIAAIFARVCYIYIKTGKLESTKLENIMLFIVIFVLIAYSIYRNAILIMSMMR